MLERIASRSDCANCAALCCVAYPSDDMPGFAASKRSGEPCPRLAQCGTCTIYEDRERLGFGGCIAYECFGAGQFVTQALSQRGARRGRTVATKAMIDRFLQVRPAFDLLHLAQRLAGDNLPPERESRRVSIVRSLEDALLSGDPASVEHVLLPAKAALRDLYAGRSMENRKGNLNSRRAHALVG